MKSAILLALLSLSLNAFAVDEVEVNVDDIAMYCEEQAQLAGIEDVNDLDLYLKDCIASFTSKHSETGEPGQ